MFIFEFFTRKNRPLSVFLLYLATMDPPEPEPQPRPVQEGRRERELTRDQIVSRLLFELQTHGVDGKFARGTIPAVAQDFHVCQRTVRNVWKRAVANYQDPDIRQFRASPQKRNSGRPRKWNHDEVREAVKLIPLFQRGTIRTLAAALGIPKSTLHDMKCDKDDPVIIPCTSALKPTLTEQHELLRACYCVSKIDPVTRLYDSFYESVHVDEKWFFITEQVLCLYITPEEDIPN
jgi:hypothetical protein